MEELQWTGDMDVISGVDGAQDKRERMGATKGTCKKEKELHRV